MTPAYGGGWLARHDLHPMLSVHAPIDTVFSFLTVCNLIVESINAIHGRGLECKLDLGLTKGNALAVYERLAVVDLSKLGANHLGPRISPGLGCLCTLTYPDIIFTGARIQVADKNRGRA